MCIQVYKEETQQYATEFSATNTDFANGARKEITR